MALTTVAITGHVLAPDGSAPTSGRLVVKLSQAGSALDGSESVRVATEVTEDLGTGGTVSFALVPNDAITPSGTYYLATFVAQLASGRRVQWAEKWQLTSDDLTLDIGSIPRIDAVPGLSVAPYVVNGDVSSMLATATGDYSSRTVADHLATLPDARVLATGSLVQRPLADWEAMTLGTMADAMGVLHLPFDRPGCIPTGGTQGTRAEALACTRASTADYVDSAGATQTCAINQSRVAPQGLLVDTTETITVANPMSGKQYLAWGVGGYFTPKNRSWGDAVRVLLAGGTLNAANSWYLSESAGALRFMCIDGGSVGHEALLASSSLSAGPHHIMVTVDNGYATIYVDGVPTTAVASGAVISTHPSLLYLGVASGGILPFAGWIRGVRVAPSASPLVVGGIPLSAAPGSQGVSCIGDSITEGTDIGGASPVTYPTRLGTSLGSGWLVTNDGHSGTGVSTALSTWNTRKLSSAYGYFAIMIGVNDLRVDTTAATIWTTLQSIYDDALSRGRRVVAMTVLPWKDGPSWTAGREAQRVLLNSSIQAYCSANATRGITYLDTATVFDDGTGKMKAAYTNDWLHPNQVGSDLLATLVKSAIP